MNSSSRPLISAWAQTALAVLAVVALVASLGLSFFAQPQIAHAASNIFSDGFEGTGTPFSNPLWEQSDNKWNISGAAKQSGSKGAHVKGNTGDSDDVLKQEESTVGYENIVLTYSFKVNKNLESNDDDEVKVQWYDGSTWTTLHTVDSSDNGDGWKTKTHSLPAGANDNANFAFRFKASLDSESSDQVYLDDVSLTGDEIEETVVDFCDPSQKPGGKSIAQWHTENNFDGSSCFDFEVVQQCGSLDVQFTNNETPYNYSFFYALGNQTPELANYAGDGALPVSFSEDENGGSVEVTYYVVGAEKDYFVGSSVPNIWDGNGTTVTVDTDCAEPEPNATLRVCKLIVDSEGTIIDGDSIDADFSVAFSGPDFNQSIDFSTALTFNADLVDDNGDSDDAQCVVFENLAAGEYLYDAEDITSEASWGTALYHDYFNETPSSVSDFYELTVDGSETDEDNADGVINLVQDGMRTLAIVNTLLGGQGGDGDQCVENKVVVSDTLTLHGDNLASVILETIHSAWTATISGASWIWSAEPMPEGYVNDVTKVFTREFTLTGEPLGGSLTIAADNSYSVTLNGEEFGCASADENNHALATQDVCTIDASDLVQGTNTLVFTVKNWAQAGGTINSNPAGLLYKLSVDEDVCQVPDETPWCSFAGEVIEYTADVDADQNDGDPVETARRNISAIENGPASYQNVGGSEGGAWSTSDFFSLGIGGYLIYEFTDSVAIDQSGDDIAIYEITGGTTDTDEKVKVEVSQDGLAWVSLGTHSGDISLDISGTGLSYVRYVKLTDESQGIQGNNGDGYDVDAIVILQGSCHDFTQCILDQELLVNGGFEAPTVDTPQNWNIFPSGTTGLGWVVEWLTGDTNAPSIANIELQKNGLFAGGASVGTQWTELDSDWQGIGGASGEEGAVAISQTILTEIGKTYTFSFDFSPRPNTSASQNAVRVVVDGASTLIDETVTASASVTQNTWTNHSYSFVADSLLTTVTLSDAGTPNDSLGTLVDNASFMCTVPAPKFSTITLCKVDENNEPLAGWTLALLGSEVGTVNVDSHNSNGADSASLTSGTSYVAIATGTYNGGNSTADVEYTSKDSWTTVNDGETGYGGSGEGSLDLQIGGQFINWGPYNSTHEYAYSFTPAVDGVVNFRTFDGNFGTNTANAGWYNDNSGLLTVGIHEGYAGITDETGCVAFNDVPVGTYVPTEIAQEGWIQTDGPDGPVEIDSLTHSFTFVNELEEVDVPTANLHVTKIVCEAEEYLPNWGNGSTGPASIDSATATAWLAEGDNSEYCELAPDWNFQWVKDSISSSNPGDNIGAADAPWNTFADVTDSNGVLEALIPAGGKVWIREILKEGYVLFSGQTTTQHESAELYCGADVLNYDNWDYIDSVVADETYYCVAFNALDIPECQEGYHYSSQEESCVPDGGSSHVDLWVEKTITTEGPYEVGDLVTYSIHVENDGPQVANAVVVTDLLPLGLVYQSHTATNEVNPPVDDFYNESTGEWTIDSLGVNGDATLTITAEIQSGYSEITNEVAVTSESSEEDTEDNDDDITISIEPEIITQSTPSGPTPTFFGGGPTGLGGGGGSVLGAFTSNGQVLGESCGLYLNQHLRWGNPANNPEQVRKLQEFLNKHGYGAFSPTGYFGPLTFAAVNAFQTEYASSILAPWNLNQPTGLVYLTTLLQINKIECPSLTLELPPLIPWSQNSSN